MGEAKRRRDAQGVTDERTDHDRVMARQVLRCGSFDHLAAFPNSLLPIRESLDFTPEVHCRRFASVVILASRNRDRHRCFVNPTFH
jgi:hypothetical protein